jgi:hypothetical protein
MAAALLCWTFSPSLKFSLEEISSLEIERLMSSLARRDYPRDGKIRKLFLNLFFSFMFSKAHTLAIARLLRWRASRTTLHI